VPLQGGMVVGSRFVPVPIMRIAHAMVDRVQRDSPAAWVESVHGRLH
jgi:hypothetical protein